MKANRGLWVRDRWPLGEMEWSTNCARLNHLDFQGRVRRQFSLLKIRSSQKPNNNKQQPFPTGRPTLMQHGSHTAADPTDHQTHSPKISEEATPRSQLAKVADQRCHRFGGNASVRQVGAACVRRLTAGSCVSGLAATFGYIRQAPRYRCRLGMPCARASP